MSTKLIIFDCFGVICHESAPFWLPRYFSAEESAFLKNTLIRQADWGEIPSAVMYRTISEKINGAESPEEIEDNWVALAKKDPETIAIIKDARKKYKTALLSNAVEGLLERLFTEAELDELFDCRAISYIEHTAKPGEAFFRLILERAGVAPEEAVFIDDNPANVAAAEALGIHAILFTDCATLRKELNL